MLSLVPYEKFSSPTYGPTWALFLGVIGRLGFPLTMALAHLLSSLIAALVCIVALIGISKMTDWFVATLLIFPLAICWGYGFNHADYWSLSTELLPLFLLVLGASISFAWAQRPLWIAFGASLLGLAAWSKYHFGLVVLMALLAAVQKLRQGGCSWLSSVSLIFVSANIWIALLAGISLTKGVPVSLVVESLEITADYIRGGGASGLTQQKDAGVATRLSALATSILTIFPLIPVLSTLVIISSRCRQTPTDLTDCYKGANWLRRIVWRSEIWVVIGAVVTVTVTYPIFPHYNYVIIGGVMVGLIISLDSERRVRRKSDISGLPPQHSFVQDKYFRIHSYLILLLAIGVSAPGFVSSSAVLPNIAISDIFDEPSARWERAVDDEGNPLSESCPPRSKVLVWGWSSEVYAFYDWIPASRYVNTVALIDNNSLNITVERYRERMSQELADFPPDCVIDATGPSFFPGFGRDESMEQQVPSIWSALQSQGTSRVFYWDSVNPIKVILRSTS
jgi:hypothetical protein